MGLFIEMMVALTVGTAIGAGFGLLQRAALRRHQRQEREGSFNNGWTLLPGSGGRIALLLIMLVVIQVICPVLFVNGIQWWVSGGVLLGYGLVLFGQLREGRTR
jgi:hypothetical protein